MSNPFAHQPDVDLANIDLAGMDTVSDGLLGLGEDPGQIDIDPKGLGLTGCGLEPPMPTPAARTTDDVADDVEGALLGLLQSGDRKILLSVTGGQPAIASQEDEGLRDFRVAYVQSVKHNPALRWYGKLASMLPAEKFGVADGALVINMTPAMFRKAMRPFLSDFREVFSDSSPIVAAVRNLAVLANQADVQTSRDTMQGGIKAQSNAEASDFNPAVADFDDSQIPDSIGDLPNQSPESYEPVAAVPRLPISLTDLSLKAVADHIAGLEGDDDTLTAHLLDAGFTKARANEIMAMSRYKRLLEAKRASRYSPDGNIGAGDVEFTFR